MIGKHCWEIFHSTQEPIPECPIQRMRKSLKRERTELHIDDRWCEVTADPILDENHGLSGAVHAVSDITERKQAEDALLEREQKYRTLTEDLPAMICEFLPDSTLTFVNKAYCEYFGMTADELISRPFLDFILEEARQSVKDQYRALTPQQPLKSYPKFMLKTPKSG